MSELILAVFVIAFGFVTAACVTTIASCFSRNDDEFAIPLNKPGGFPVRMVFLMFSGPYLVAGNGLNHWREDKSPAWASLLYLFTVLCWSFCLGVLVVQTLIGLGTLSAL